jgi:hypothetical protein
MSAACTSADVIALTHKNDNQHAHSRSLIRLPRSQSLPEYAINCQERTHTHTRARARTHTHTQRASPCMTLTARRLRTLTCPRANRDRLCMVVEPKACPSDHPASHAKERERQVKARSKRWLTALARVFPRRGAVTPNDNHLSVRTRAWLADQAVEGDGLVCSVRLFSPRTIGTLGTCHRGATLSATVRR